MSRMAFHLPLSLGRPGSGVRTLERRHAAVSSGVMGNSAITISQVGGHPPHIATPNHTNSRDASRISKTPLARANAISVCGFAAVQR